MSIIAPQIIQKFTDSAGLPLAAGLLYTYAAGTTTPLATYTDSTGSTPNANPIVLDANGQCDLWLGSSAYKFVLKNAAGVTQKTVDNVTFPTVSNGFSTGDVKLSLKSVADSGWVLMNDTTIGNAASSATGRANADTIDLFTLLWNNTINTWCAVSAGRGASAAADFAANKTIALPKSLGRALAISGFGSGLTSRVLAQYLGEESHVLTTAELASHTHIQNSHNHIQDPHQHTTIVVNSAGGSVGAQAVAGSTTQGAPLTPTAGATATNQVATAVNQNAGSDTAHNNMQPSLFLNIMIKL